MELLIKKAPVPAWGELQCRAAAGNENRTVALCVTPAAFGAGVVSKSGVEEPGSAHAMGLDSPCSPSWLFQFCPMGRGVCTFCSRRFTQAPSSPANTGASNHD